MIRVPSSRDLKTPIKNPRDETSVIEVSIGVIGKGRVGKTAIVQQYLHSVFKQDHEATIEEAHVKLTVCDMNSILPRAMTSSVPDIPTDVLVKLNILDTGAEDVIGISYESLAKLDGFLMVYSKDVPDSADYLHTVYDNLERIRFQLGLSSPPIVIIGNKTDDTLTRQMSTYHRIRTTDCALADRLGCPRILSSAMRRTMIDESFEALIFEILRGSFVQSFSKLLPSAERCRTTRDSAQPRTLTRRVSSYFSKLKGKWTSHKSMKINEPTTTSKLS
jgi:GTPase SAR1 family protein